MTTLRRLISGSAAVWVRIIVTMVSQILLVPVYLSYWGKETYGVWLALQALTGVIFLVGIGHHNYLGNEFMKAGVQRPDLIRRIFYSSLPLALSIGLIELLFVIVATSGGWIDHLLGFGANDHSQLMYEARIVLIIQSLTWLTIGCVSGIVVRVVVPFGYYARMEWWGGVAALCTTFGPVIAVVAGANLLWAGLAQCLATMLYAIPQLVHMVRILRREKLHWIAPDISFGLRNFRESTALAAKGLLEMTRQQGIRLILVPMVGVADMTAFATMRTGANVALQGLGTITNPLMPELMRSLVDRNQQRTEVMFSFVWLMLIGVLVPGVLLLQYWAPVFFPIWTRGKIDFNPGLFATLSSSVLIYALAQPAIAIAQGNNLLKEQLFQSILSGALLLLAVFFLVPRYGILGAGMALVLAEVVNLVGYLFFAVSWLKGQGMRWPWRQFTIGLIAVLIALLTMGALIHLPRWSQMTLVIALLAQALLGTAYWFCLPELAHLRVQKLLLAWRRN